MQFKLNDQLPYCPGCGHHHIARSITDACQALSWSPLDVILVTDIGCVGLADKYFPTHTIHGLHGRSPALAAGIRLGLTDTDKHIIVLIGDGGATIGLNHILEASRRNLPMTVIIHNNFLYGMTGGQSSGLTPPTYKTATDPEGPDVQNYDLSALIQQAEASYVARVLATGKLTKTIRKAFTISGFSAIEVIENCHSHGTKRNEKQIQKYMESANLELGSWTNDNNPVFEPDLNQNPSSLFDGLGQFDQQYEPNLDDRSGIKIAGSAGEGVQTAATVLAQAGLLCGLHASKSGSYPVTVGSGFSAGEVKLSSASIGYTGMTKPDVLIITSQQGVQNITDDWSTLTPSSVFVDASLTIPGTSANINRAEFRSQTEPKGAAMAAIAYWAAQRQVLPKQALRRSAEYSNHPQSIKRAIETGYELMDSSDNN